ncbi:TPA: ROK family protein [Candidatus Poribacteria bacterium]|nr:ROK family protein [Candidatus Poribacteria bacterium]HIB90187.1 ROK family protein [Candidatus Poribacteria bacterium]HIB99490.1 ROK family protein [Candidatus Poribacteria bacterium]HIC18995.1 ROK family protein [Candidatus Poribacteria bacterium]HIN29811.1 ROK family protein [Candidatus Poribacteria bacterium]
MGQRLSLCLVGVDIGGTKLATVVADANGQILNKVRQPTESHRGFEHAIKLIVDMIDQLLHLEQFTRDQISAIGISCGGPLDTKTGVVYSPPNLPDWDAIPLADIVESEFKIRPVIENDANAGALAEWRFGAGRGYNHVVFMTMSTGIGAGIVVDGRILHGASDCAGEVGHQVLIPNGPVCGCGNRGCLEAICSGPAIAQRAQEKVRKNPHTKILDLVDDNIEAIRSEEVLEAAKSADPLALDLIHEISFYMGWGIANLVNIINPDIVLIGTIAVAAGDLLLDPIRRTVLEMSMQRPGEIVKIMPAQLGQQIGDLAAISLVV